jgi:hypothetical protein
MKMESEQNQRGLTGVGEKGGLGVHQYIGSRCAVASGVMLPSLRNGYFGFSIPVATSFVV